jgi:hypothetical protein
MNHLYLAVLVFISSAAFADSLDVSGYKQIPNDISAQRFDRYDANDQLCALIKVISDIDNLNFDAGMRIVGNVEKKAGEYWVYVSPGERRLSIWGSNLIRYNFNLPTIPESGKVYQMVAIRKGETDFGGMATGFIVIKSQPPGATVWIDNEYMGTTPFQREMTSGYYNYRLEKEMFYPKEGGFTVKVNETVTEEVLFNPNFGSLTLTTTPVDGARITLDGVPTNYRTPHTFDTLSSGRHTIVLSLDLYEPVSREITVRDSENTPISIDLNPVFGNVEITTSPDADIYIDDELRATGSFADILQKGVHTIEVKKDRYYTQTRKIDMKAGETETWQVELEPIVGSLSIMTSPPEASITIDGESYGITPKIIPEIQIGTYEITLKKENYAVVITTVEVMENERTKVEQDLSNFKEITISSNPSNANLFLNGKNEGTTPKTLTANFGMNTLRLTKQGYNDLEESFTVTEQKSSYFFTMVSDQKALAQMDYKKYKRQKNIWLAGTIASAAAGGYFAYSANQAGKDYETATTDATSLYDKMEQHYTYSYAAFGVSSVCAIFTIINASKQSKAKKQMNISAIPVEGGGVLSLRVDF